MTNKTSKKEYSAAFLQTVTNSGETIEECLKRISKRYELDYEKHKDEMKEALMAKEHYTKLKTTDHDCKGICKNMYEELGAIKELGKEGYKKYKEEAMKEYAQHRNCPKCSYFWKPRTSSPKACPRCKCRLDMK